jgi:hypothetical protein
MKKEASLKKIEQEIDKLTPQDQLRLVEKITFDS